MPTLWAVDVLSFGVEGTPIQYGTDGAGNRVPYGGAARLEILVNGEDLRSLVQRAEKRDATADSQPDLAGSYHYLSGYEFPSGLFYGQPEGDWDSELSYKERVAVMGCNCGVIGCWPFLVRIDVNPDEISWSDFRQPFRSWRYDALGPFHFEREQYDQAIKDAAATFADTAQYTDEMASAFARSIRNQFVVSDENLNGLLVALARRDEITERTDEERQELFRDHAKLKAAAKETADILGLTERQGLVIVARDLSDVREAAIRDQLAEEKRLAALPDDELREAYSRYVKNLRSALSS